MKKFSLRGLLAVLLICWATIYSTYLLSKTNFYIKDAWATTNTISVDGEWKIYAQPDVLNISVEVAETKENTQLAQTAVNEKIAKIHEFLKSQNINTDDIQTTNVTVYPEYDYTQNWSKLKWYRAAHNLLVKIKKINSDNKDKWSIIIDQIASIGWVTISNISYDIEDKTEVYSQARKLAMEKANQKAQEIAKVAWVKLNKPVSISESIYNNYPTPIYRNSYVMEEKAMDSAGWTSISLWQLEITLTVNVVYGIE